jgi:ABC-type spermidine/putrescine transport system permease subunit II
MKGISSFRNEIEIPFIFNVNGQQTLGMHFLSQRRRGTQSSLFILETCQCVFIFMVTLTRLYSYSFNSNLI